MTEYGYTDPRSIFSERSIQKIRTRTPEEILKTLKEKEEEEMNLLDQAKEVLGNKQYFGTKTLARALGITGKKASILFRQLDWERWAVGSCTVVYRKKEAKS